ncbi:MAG: hypothetical protein R2991_16550 [Thermoanaerobaculia bacterium]
MERGTGLVIVGGIAAAVGFLVLGSRPAHAAVVRAAPAADERGWVRRVIAFVSATEGRADSLNRNLDGAGLSFGILQWNQRAGNLGVVLRAMQAADPAAFPRIFGPSWTAVLEVAGRGSLERVDGAVLWEEPWVSRFVAAGRYPPFVDVQWQVAEHGEHFQAALDVARMLGARTERAVALFFDRAVQQGPGAARRMAEELLARGVPPYPAVLRAYAELAASRFRRNTPPESPFYSARAKHIVWKPVGGEWHAVAGRWDLHTDVTRRTGQILRDRSLADAPV